ncbi:hypothetical protein H5410_051960 [Solanum commersonii]|uniref:Uncharacterized protein n=1 Tax=Solanum commersonii TaxID=4109 RepID=A0A9J5X1M7_SOLCO|nr:hypothetical protein H5410_051960 [Solanum commersonii]
MGQFTLIVILTLDINDPNVMDSLTLNVKTKKLNSKINTREIDIIYQVYYRLMKTTLAPKALVESLKDILSINDWRFENITHAFASHSERSQIERVVQFPDGSIEFKFLDNSVRKSSSYRRSSRSGPSISCPSRPVSRPPSSSKPPEEAEDKAISVADTNKGKVTGVDFLGDIPKLFYQDIPGSPSASEMEPTEERLAWLGMLKIGKAFEPNPDILHEQWTHPDNQVKKK